VNQRSARELLLGILAATLVGCDSGNMAKIEKQNQEILAQLRRQEQFPTYDLEAKCAEEAKHYFGEHWRPDKMTAVLNYTNHYNRSLNKCLILVREQTFMDANNEWHIAVILADVHERNEFGLFLESHASTSAQVTKCHVAESPCTSQADFEDRIKPYTTN